MTRPAQEVRGKPLWLADNVSGRQAVLLGVTGSEPTELHPSVGFDAFVRLEGPRLKGLARLLVGDDWLAEELLQDVLARCLPRWEQISAGDPVAYIRRSLIHARVSHWRKFRREKLGTVPERSVASHEAALLDALFLESLLRRLSRRQRQIVALRYSYDLSEADIARALSVSVGTVKSQHSRAIAHLRAFVAVPAATPSTPREVTGA